MRSLNEIYGFLAPGGYSPEDVGTDEGRAAITPRTFESLLSNVIGNDIDYNTEAKIIETLETTITTIKSTPAESEKLKEYDRQYFIVGSNKTLKFDPGSSYWKVPSSRIPPTPTPGRQAQAAEADLVEVKKASDILSPAAQNKLSQGKLNIFCAAVRNPYVSQSTRGTSVISRFLNYTPNIIASQLIPYLDVEFYSPVVGESEYAQNLNKPSIMRFLLGSGESGKSPGDIALIESTLQSAGGKVQSAVASMNMFLSPQTMTNMDSLSDGRATKVKPFVPFASIEQFDVKIQNAGAGKFASKRGTLKFKMHDKARLGEFSDFVRGSVGYNQNVIWTTSGWLAPRNSSASENEYFDFINKNFLVRDAWKVGNTQFSFDQSGQLTFTLDLYAAAGKGLQESPLTTAGSFNAASENIRKAMQTLAELKSRYFAEDQFASDMQATQVLNAATATGTFKDLKAPEIAAAFAKIDGAAKRAILKKEDADAWENAMKVLAGTDGPASAKSAVARYGYDRLSDTAPGTSAEYFKEVTRDGYDLFLPDEARNSYYHADLIPNLKKVANEIVTKNKEVNQAAAGKEKQAGEVRFIDLGSTAPLVSFGKLFMEAITLATLELGDCDELQVYFYCLNRSCGPVSGLSVAEYPIAVQPLAYAYAEHLKSSNTSTISLQEYLRLIVETSFNDIRAPAYGMTAYYKPFDKTKPKDAEIATNAAAAQAGLEKWYAKYGSLRIPVIEMYVETGVSPAENTSSAARPSAAIIDKLKSSPYIGWTRGDRSNTNGSKSKIVKRVHVYDKQSTPHNFAQKVFLSGGTVRVGELNTDGLSTALSDAMAQLEKANKKAYAETLTQLEAATASNDSLKAYLGNVEGAAAILKEIDDSSEKGYALGAFGSEAYKKRVKAELVKSVPSIIIGTNGTLVHNMSLSSKTDGALAAKNLAEAYKGPNAGKPTLSSDGLSQVSGLPLRVVPAQLTMTTHGVPNALLYQTYFVDMDTGTSIDNLYLCTSLQHSMTKGKFTTTWAFAYTNGYPQYEAPPDLSLVALGQARAVVQSLKAAEVEKKANQPPKAAPKKTPPIPPAPANP